MIFRNNQNNVNSYNFSFSPVRDDRNVNIEISYDNFDTVNLDMARKQQYGQDLRQQMEENERKRKAEKERKKIEDLEEELRLQRERELLEKRQDEENKRYRPKIDLPIQKKPEKKENVENDRYTVVNNIHKNTLSDSALNYLRDRENQIDDFNDKMMKSLQLLNKEYQYNINSLRGQIGVLNDIHDKNKKRNDQFCKDIYDIKDNLDYRKKQNGIDANHLYDLVAKSNYANQMMRFKIGNVPRRNFEIRSYTSNKRIGIDDERKGDGLTIPSYINFSRDVPYYGPRWRQNESVWWCY